MRFHRADLEVGGTGRFMGSDWIYEIADRESDDAARTGQDPPRIEARAVVRARYAISPCRSAASQTSKRSASQGELPW